MSARKCKTPGASFVCESRKPNSGHQPCVRFMVVVPSHIGLSETRVKKLERAFHKAMEDAMAPWWPKEKTNDR